MAQLGLADNYIRRMSITSSLAPSGTHAVWPVGGGDGDTRPPVVYAPNFGGKMSKAFAASWFGRFFDLEHRRTTLVAEMRAGLVGFLTVRGVEVVVFAEFGGGREGEDPGEMAARGAGGQAGRRPRRVLLFFSLSLSGFSHAA